MTKPQVGKQVKKPTKKQKGRPSAFRSEFIPRIAALARLGATMPEMADALGVALRTLERWAKVHDGFRRSLRGGKVESDQVVSESLYQRAQGYAYDEEQAFKVKEVVYEHGTRVKDIERIQVVTVHRVLPPDITAMIFWLKNRRPIEWRDRREIDATTNGKDLQVLVWTFGGKEVAF